MDRKLRVSVPVVLAGEASTMVESDVRRYLTV
jgi:hypothetical protein